MRGGAGAGLRADLLAYCHYMLHKPAGLISQRQDEFPNICRLFDDLVRAGRVAGPPPSSRRASPVGRLDKDTTGLILFTTHGLLSRNVTDGGKISKRYIATVRGNWSDGDEAIAGLVDPLRYCRRLTCSGREVWTRPVDARVLRSYRLELENPKTPPRLGDHTEIEFVLGEGRFHQIRRLCHRAGLFITALHRESIGPLELGPLPEGEARALCAAEVAALYEACGMPCPRIDGPDPAPAAYAGVPQAVAR